MRCQFKGNLLVIREEGKRKSGDTIMVFGKVWERDLLLETAPKKSENGH